MDDKAMFSEGQAIGPYKIVRCIGDWVGLVGLVRRVRLVDAGDW